MLWFVGEAARYGRLGLVESYTTGDTGKRSWEWCQGFSPRLGGRGKETRERILDSCGTEIENRYGDLKKPKRECFVEVMWAVTSFVFNLCEIFKAVGEREGGIRSNVR